MNKYTVYGDSGFDDKIDGHMREIREAVLAVVPEKDLSALILGGGYGRGEGGVFVQDGKMELYNDFDFFIISNNISRSKMREYHSKLFEVSEELTEKIGIDVDFGPFKNISELATMRFTMMWCELKRAHIVVYGDENTLDAIPDFQPNEIPLSEAMGLILNRAVGLMLVKRRLDDKKELTREDTDFIERNITKAAMAAGDAFLICNHTFDHSYVKRMELMDAFKKHAMIKGNDFLNIYKEAVMYKLKPTRTNPSRKTLRESHKKISNLFKAFFLFTAEACWNINLTDFTEFAECASTNSIPEESRSNIIKNLILNATKVGFAGFTLSWFVKYPRYRLFYAVPYLAFSERGYEKGIPAALGLPQNASKEEIYTKFINLWERFN